MVITRKKKLKKGTFFSLYGKVYGYDISLFNKYNEEEILLEPEKKFRIENVIPDPNGIINVTCEILDSPNILDHLEYDSNKYLVYEPVQQIKRLEYQLVQDSKIIFLF